MHNPEGEPGSQIRYQEKGLEQADSLQDLDDVKGQIFLKTHHYNLPHSRKIQ